MKLLLIVLFAVSGCATGPRAEDLRPNYGEALSEVYRRGDVAKAPYRAYENKSSHTCISTPVWSHGYVIRTDVRCQ